MQANRTVFLRSASFLLIFFLLLLAISGIFAPKDNTKESGMTMIQANGILGERENSIDVLVVGDSESYSSISPMHIWSTHGFTSYVCGTAGQPLDDSYRFLEQAFAYQKPSVVILETNAIFRERNAANYLSSFLKSRFSIFQYHNRWKSMGIRDLYRRADYTWTNDLKGYLYFKEAVPASTEHYMAATDAVESIPDLNLFCLRQIQRICEANHAQLILVSTPSTLNWNRARHNAIRGFSENSGVPYLDMNLITEEIGIDWATDTRDKGDHLNFSGARKTSEYLSTYLKERYPLPDHRREPQYQSWNESYQRYSRIISA